MIALALLCLLGAVLWWWLTPQEAAAHANLVSAEPAPNSELDEAPDRVIAWFTEPLEPSLSSIEVLDSSGQRVDLDNSIVDDLNPLVMSVDLDEIPDGTYTVAWTNVSTVDGHRVRGSFLFAVGQTLSAVPVQVEEQPLFQSPFSPLLRWLTLLGALAMVGGLVFEMLVMRPTLKAGRPPDALTGAAGVLSSQSLRLTWVALAIFIVASVGQLLLLTTITRELSLWQAFGSPVLETATDTEWGEVWLWRVAAAIGFGILLYGQPAIRPGAVAASGKGRGAATGWSSALDPVAGQPRGGHGRHTEPGGGGGFSAPGRLCLLDRRPVPSAGRREGPGERARGGPAGNGWPTWCRGSR